MQLDINLKEFGGTLRVVLIKSSSSPKNQLCITIFHNNLKPCNEFMKLQIKYMQ